MMLILLLYNLNSINISENEDNLIPPSTIACLDKSKILFFRIYSESEVYTVL